LTHTGRSRLVIRYMNTVVHCMCLHVCVYVQPHAHFFSLYLDGIVFGVGHKKVMNRLRVDSDVRFDEQNAPRMSERIAFNNHRPNLLDLERRAFDMIPVYPANAIAYITTLSSTHSLTQSIATRVRTRTYVLCTRTHRSTHECKHTHERAPAHARTHTHTPARTYAHNKLCACTL
jgi:hypothetical protein